MAVPHKDRAAAAQANDFIRVRRIIMHVSLECSKGEGLLQTSRNNWVHLNSMQGESSVMRATFANREYPCRLLTAEELRGLTQCLQHFMAAGAAQATAKACAL
jgi:hypothetical protein